MIHGENIIYVRIDWENYPSDRTPVNECNLNKMDLALHLLDERVVWLNENKFDKTESFKLVKNIDLDEESGIFTVTYYDNSTKTIDTILEKIATNWDFDEISQQLIITLDDGTVKRVDLSSLITQYEFMTSDTISLEVQPDGKVKAIVREGSIQEKHLRPDYLADIRLEQGKAQQSAEEAEGYAKLSESYTHGGTGIRENEESDNAMEYANKAKEYSNEWKGSLLPQGAISFSQLPTSGNLAGHMYNISEAFETDSRFEEGAGYSYPSGTNVYWNANEKWDCLSGALTRFLTQAEYDSLTQSVQKNGTIYFITDSDAAVDPGESDYLIPVASPDTLGGVKTGYVQNGRNFPVQLDEERMYVNVPESTGGSVEQIEEIQEKVIENTENISNILIKQQELSGEVAEHIANVQAILTQPLLTSKLLEQSEMVGSYQTTTGRIFLNPEHLRVNHFYLLKIVIQHNGGLSQPRDINIIPQFVNENTYFFATPFIITAGIETASWQTTAIFYKSSEIDGSIGYYVKPLNSSVTGWSSNLLNLTITCKPYEFFSVQAGGNINAN